MENVDLDALAGCFALAWEGQAEAGLGAKEYTAKASSSQPAKAADVRGRSGQGEARQGKARTARPEQSRAKGGHCAKRQGCRRREQSAAAASRWPAKGRETRNDCTAHRPSRRSPAIQPARAWLWWPAAAQPSTETRQDTNDTNAQPPTGPTLNTSAAQRRHTRAPRRLCGH